MQYNQRFVLYFFVLLFYSGLLYCQEYAENIVMLNKNLLTRKLVIKYIYKTNNLVNLYNVINE